MTRQAEQPTQAEIAKAMSHKPVYKVVRKAGKKLLSLWVRGTEEEPLICRDEHCNLFTGFTLTYARGKLTANGRYGIFCNRTLRGARGQAGSNGYGKMCLIFKAYPLGKRIRNDSNYGDYDTVLYPAIILDKRTTEIIDNRHSS